MKGQSTMIDEKKIIQTLQGRIDDFLIANPERKDCESVQVIREFIQLLEYEAKMSALKTEKEVNLANAQEWFRTALKANEEFIYRLLYKEEQAVLTGQHPEKWLSDGKSRDEGTAIYYITYNGCRYPNGHCPPAANFMNCERLRSGRKKYQCSITGMVCDIFFVVSPADWKGMEYLTEQTVPEQLQGWTREANNEDFDMVYGFSSAGWRQIQQSFQDDQ